MSSSSSNLQNINPIVIASAAITLVALLATTAFFIFKSKSASNSTASSSSSSGPREVFLNKERKSVKLAEIIQLSPDTKLFRFALPNKESILGLPVGKHFKVWCPNPAGNAAKKGEWNGRADAEAELVEIERKYTPTSSDDDIGHFDLVIKVYRPNERFSDGGKMSLYFDSLKVGDSIDISGPWGLIEYTGKGGFKKMKNEFNFKHVGMLAGGTGITPMLQITAAALKDKEDPTSLRLIFGNQTINDILVKDLLDKYAEANANRFKVHYTLDRPPENGEWKGSKGFVTKEMIIEHLPPPGEDTAVLICGPPPFVASCQKNLAELGYKKEHIFEF